MSAKVNLRQMLVDQIFEEADKMILENNELRKPVSGKSKRIWPKSMGEIFLREVKTRVTTDGKTRLLCTTNYKDRNLLFVNEGQMLSGPSVIAMFDEGSPVLVMDYKYVGKLAVVVDGHLQITVDDPHYVPKPVTLLLDRGGRDPKNVMFFGDIAGKETKDLTGDFSDMGNVQIMINICAALISLVMGSA